MPLGEVVSILRLTDSGGDFVLQGAAFL